MTEPQNTPDQSYVPFVPFGEPETPSDSTAESYVPFEPATSEATAVIPTPRNEEMTRPTDASATTVETAPVDAMPVSDTLVEYVNDEEGSTTIERGPMSAPSFDQKKRELIGRLRNPTDMSQRLTPKSEASLPPVPCKDFEDECKARKIPMRKCYKRLALKYHPDKGGDANTFRRLDECMNPKKSSAKTMPKLKAPVEEDEEVDDDSVDEEEDSDDGSVDEMERDEEEDSVDEMERDEEKDSGDESVDEEEEDPGDERVENKREANCKKSNKVVKTVEKNGRTKRYRACQACVQEKLNGKMIWRQCQRLVTGKFCYQHKDHTGKVIKSRKTIAKTSQSPRKRKTPQRYYCKRPYDYYDSDRRERQGACDTVGPAKEGYEDVAKSRRGCMRECTL